MAALRTEHPGLAINIIKMQIASLCWQLFRFIAAIYIEIFMSVSREA
jgi:hypothetical protein